MSGSLDSNTQHSQIAMRTVTQEEVEFFFEHGWVHIPGLIDPVSARLLLNQAKAEFGDDGRRGVDESVKVDSYNAWFRSKPDPYDDEIFRGLALSSELGRNAARLLGRNSSIRLMVSAMMAKLPAGSQRGAPTDYHQDICGHTYLEANFLTAWVALDEVTPDMGSMRFYSGSHKLGNLGRIMEKEIWEGWIPLLTNACSVTEPIHYQPGDATFHMAATIHGTAENLGSNPRWSWAGVLVPGDARYTGAENFITDGLGLKPMNQIDHPKFPIIYLPESRGA